MAYKKADYAHALSRSDTDVQMYLFELSCALVCALGTVECWGGDREDMALSYVYANSGCVAARWLCVL